MPPITKSAAVTASLEADELAVAMDHLRVSAELLELNDSHRLFWPLDQFPPKRTQGAELNLDLEPLRDRGRSTVFEP